jgi:hypothetical protein
MSYLQLTLPKAGKNGMKCKEGSHNFSYTNVLNISIQTAAATCSRWFLARGFFYHKDGDDTFLRNVGSYKIYTAPHPRRRHSSQKEEIMKAAELHMQY